MKNFLKHLIFSLCIGLFAQQAFSQTISGNVTDESGVPLPGANVIIEGTSIGVSTDFDGNFSIQADQGQVIQFSYIGYTAQRVTVENQDSINISLQPDNQLEEVIVTSLGFTVVKDQQGSTSSVVNTQSVLRSGEPTIANALSGKASGVRISRSNGDPGAGSTIRIRGANTIDGSSQPLIIVDGVPLDNTTSYAGGNSITGGRTGGVSQGSRLNDINPSDIESLQVLKGASAAALWGSRAANGVIVINTKKGQRGEAKITFKSSYSLDEISERIPMQDTWGQGRSGVWGSNRAESWGDYIPERSGGADIFDTSGAYFEAADGSLYYPITQKNSKETFLEENFNSLFQTGVIWQNDLTISGGGENSTYFFSLGYLTQDGIIREATYDRTNLRLNYESKLNDYLTFSSKVAYTFTDSNRIQQNSNTAGVMLGFLRTPPDFDQRDYIGTYYSSSGEAFINRHRSYRRPLGEAVNPSYNNPLWTVFEQVSDTKVNRLTATPQLTIKPTNWLQIITRANADVGDDRRNYFFPIGSAGNRSVGVLQEDVIGTRNLSFDAIGKASFELSSQINLTTTAGWSINDRKYNRTSGNITGFLVNSTKETTSLNTAAEASSFENFKTLRRSNRGYGILNFDLFDELFVNFSGALEASSTIDGSFFYPATDLAWNFTNSVLKSDVLSFGKLRASWGKVGVQPSPHRFETLAEGSFSYSTYSDPLNVDLFGGGFRLDNNLGNPNLQPEIKTEWEIGADLRFLNDDLSFSFTYYDNKIEGILLDVTLSPSSGYATQYGNFGEMVNQGIEFDLGWNIIEKEDFGFSASINWSTNENEVTDLFGTESINLSPGASVSSRAIVGQPLGVLFGTGSKTKPDGSFDLDENGFPQITSSEIILGDPNPDWRGGLSLNMNYKNFRVNALIEHSQGGVFSPRTLHVLNRFGTTEMTANRETLSQDLVNYAGNTINAGTIVRGNIEDFGGGPVLLDESWYRTGIGGGFGDNQAYNFSTYDASFTKLREITFSYVFDNPTLKSSTGLSSIILSLSGRNLLNLNNIPGIDPETNQTGVGQAQGLDYFTNPQTKSTFFSVTLNY
ncbi:SusC/RagA family TonB-linked outer membrane protein [Flavobacteriaceae bacterium]|nr:SusC/RagA family TonB-linked outer membrane protein [Flavobacteriaceae bacterium]MDB2340323.1 SusC/RagA family TonB-linked outer membrane protein [Flavobacteriaceae bacterium]